MPRSTATARRRPSTHTPRSDAPAAARHSHERGSSLVEAALLVPPLVATLYATLVLADLGLAALWPRELARFAAFAVASHPLSALEAPRLTQAAHDAAFERARLAVLGEVAKRNRDRGSERTDRLQTVTVALETLAITSSVPALVPPSLDPRWAEPHTALAMTLQLLGLGASPGDLATRAVRVIGLDERGLCRVDAAVSLRAPGREHDELTREVGGLDRWPVLGASMTLVVDPWRVVDGGSAEPTGPDAGAPSTNRGFGNAVTAVDDHIVEAWPLGPLVARLVDVRPPALPAGIENVLGLPAFAPAAHLVSRPYARPRGAAAPGGEASGQVDVFALTHARAEAGAVTTFETLPLDDGGLAEALARRGRWFLGCPSAERRECRR